MPSYRYKAVHSDGRAVTGTMEEASARRVTAVLEEQGLQVNSVEPIAPVREFPFLRGRLSWEDIQFLNSQLVSLTRSGLPIAPALEAIGKELRRGKLKTIVDDLHAALNSGSSLHEALERHKGAVPPVYVAAIRAGEESGNLPAILELCAGYTAQMVALKSRMLAAMTYPIVVLIIMVLMLVYLLNVTIPMFAIVFQDFGANLPGLTTFWIEVSRITRQSFGWITLGACVAVIAAVLVGRTQNGRYAADLIRLRVWGIGRAFNSATMARFCRTLGVLLSGKAPLDSALELAAATCGNAVLREAALDARDSVHQGTRLALAFEMTGYFTGLFCWLVQVSEERGDTHEALLAIATNYEESFSRQSRTIISIFTPAIVIVMALVVLSVILGLYLPIFSLADAISGQ